MTHLDFVRRCIGPPAVTYSSKGRDWSSCDCWGLVRLYYAEVLGIKLPEYAVEYTDAEELDEVARLVVEGRANWVRVSPPQVGDVVLQRLLSQPVHVGIFNGDGRMLHVRRGTEACLERIDGPVWGRRVEGFYRYVG